MSDHREVPPSSRTDFATMEPGVRAARDRLKLTQEQVAARMNRSIHTFRRWDQGKNRPARLEEMQLLALILKTPIDVIWPAERDPLVAEALRLEQQRVAPQPGQSPARPVLPDVTDDTEIRVRRPEEASVRPPDETTQERSLNLASEPRPDVERARPESSPGGLPPWPDDELDEEPQGNGLPVDAGSGLLSRELPAPERRASATSGPRHERAAVDHHGVTTLRAPRPASGRRVRRVVVAVGAALVLGGIAALAASALGERSADADPSSQSVPAQAVESERVEARARDVAAMRAAAERGHYDAAIAAARSLGDMKALERYRLAAANVLVRRADVAAGRGDLGLARQRLRRAAQRYGATPAAGDVEAHIRRIQRARVERAERRREAARKRAQQALTTSSAPASSESAASPIATESSDAAASSTNDASSAASSSSTPESSDAESGSGGDTCSDGCGLGSFPSAGQEGQKR